MKAAVLHGREDLRIEQVPIPEFGPDEVLIKVRYNGLCGTDATEFSKGPMMVPLEKPHPNSKHFGPTILGHEFIGHVVDAGNRAREMIGMRVACGAGVSCGKCRMCKSGRTNLCDSYYTLGLSTNGGLAEFVSAPKSICIPIPDTCSDEDAALAQPLAVGIHAVRRAKVAAGNRIALLGVGAIGSFVCVALKDFDIEVTAIDIDQSRLDAAMKLGAKKAILIPVDISPQGLREIVGLPSDVVFETSGTKSAAARALAITRDGGTLLLLGLNKTPQEFPFFDAVLREVTLETSAAHVCSDDIPAALEILKSSNIADLLTEKIVPLENSLEAFESLSAGRARGKILIAPTL